MVEYNQVKKLTLKVNRKKFQRKKVSKKKRNFEKKKL